MYRCYPAHLDYDPPRPYGVGRAPIRLQDLPKGMLHEPTGRGPGTAAGRGADVERLLEHVVDDVKLDRKPYRDAIYTSRESEWGARFCSSIESKSCVRRYPSGAAGTFRIWRWNHQWLVSVGGSFYFMLVYEPKEHERAREVGKWMVSAEKIEDIIDGRWRWYRGGTSIRRYIDLRWDQVVDELDITHEMLRRWELIHA